MKCLSTEWEAEAHMWNVPTACQRVVQNSRWRHSASTAAARAETDAPSARARAASVSSAHKCTCLHTNINVQLWNLSTPPNCIGQYISRPPGELFGSTRTYKSEQLTLSLTHAAAVCCLLRRNESSSSAPLAFALTFSARGSAGLLRARQTFSTHEPSITDFCANRTKVFFKIIFKSLV